MIRCRIIVNLLCIYYFRPKMSKTVSLGKLLQGSTVLSENQTSWLHLLYTYNNLSKRHVSAGRCTLIYYMFILLSKI